MMRPVDRIDGTGANAIYGDVVVDVPKAIWNLGMVLLAVLLAPLYFSLDAFFLFVIVTYFSLLIGHSAGMHRLMIHHSYQCVPWLERLLIYVGVLVGMSGPLGIIKIHDLRDWAQRQTSCHPFFSHERSYLTDIWWQLTSKFVFAAPPSINIESKYSEDRFYFSGKDLAMASVSFSSDIIRAWRCAVCGVGNFCSCGGEYCWALDDHLFLPQSGARKMESKERSSPSVKHSWLRFNYIWGVLA